MLFPVLAKLNSKAAHDIKYQMYLAVCNACNGYDEDEEEYGENSEAFGCSSLVKSKLAGVSGERLWTHTNTPWSQANMASSYKRVTRSQRAVIYPKKKTPTVRTESGCIC